MEPYQPSTGITSPVVITETTKLQLASPVSESANLTEASEKKKNLDENLEGFIGIVDVYIHQARDIHNICIYQNQDVYAKLWLTSDPEQTVSTQIINGGGSNPVFNENVQFSVRTVNSTLRCEVWMLSRIRNYLEDQLLGFTMVPVSVILIENGKLSKEFSLSSSDLLHSPAGFLQLTLTYNGVSPEVMEIPRPRCCLVVDGVDKDSGVNDAISNQLEKIEFPDLDIVDENECLASEYFVIPCPDLESKNADQCDSTENGAQISPRSHVYVQETLDVDSQVATGVPLQTPSTTFATKSSPRIPESQTQDDVSGLKAGTASEVEESVKSTPQDIPAGSFTWPVINETIEPDQNVVQQEIIDLYMKSMNQFTEALAKMKLPMDIENGSSTENVAGSSVKSGSGEKSNALKDAEPSPKVFYGSGAFF